MVNIGLITLILIVINKPEQVTSPRANYPQPTTQDVETQEFPPIFHSIALFPPQNHLGDMCELVFLGKVGLGERRGMGK